MDILDEELIRFWRALNENGVRYLMIGGFATRFHGFNRSTDDLDLWRTLNRPKDQIDVIELEKIKKIREKD